MNIFEISIYAAMIITSLVLLMTLYRFFMGPSLPDRVTAFDLVAYTFIAMTCIFAVIADDPAFMDIAIVLSLVAFMGAISFGYFLKYRRKMQKDKDKENQSS